MWETIPEDLHHVLDAMDITKRSNAFELSCFSCLDKKAIIKAAGNSIETQRLNAYKEIQRQVTAFQSKKETT